MAKLGSVELVADKDVKKGEETKINELFTSSEQRKEFKLLEDVTRDKTGIKITIAKLGSFETKADTSKKKGEKTNLWKKHSALYADFYYFRFALNYKWTFPSLRTIKGDGQQQWMSNV